MAGLATGGQTKHWQPAAAGSGPAGPGPAGTPPTGGGAHARHSANDTRPAHDTRPARAPGRLAALRTTPGRLRTAIAVIVLVACGLGVLTALVFGSVNAGLTSIGGTDAPLVEESTGLYFSVNDMDAQVANVLLAGHSTDPALAADRSQDLSIYAADRQRAEQELQQVTATSAGNPTAQHAVGTILGALSQYEALAADAILTNQNGNDPPGRPSAATLGYYQQATDLMQNAVLPAAGSLTSANANSLDSSYSQDHSAAQNGRLFIVLLGVVLIALLVTAQVFLAIRYRRMINLGLVAATLLAIVFTVAGAAQLGAQASQLRVAKVDAFDSILALSQARAVSYDANANESRYLVDPGRAAAYQNDFLTQSRQLADVGNVGIFQYDAALASDIDAYRSDNADVRFNGYLGTEFRNITFPGERAAAVKALLAYQVYERDDRHLRALAKANLDEAIAYDVGTSPGQSDWAFNNWDTALTSVIAINQDAFNTAIHDGHSDGSGWNGPIPAIAVVAIAVIALAGTRRRLAEYR